MLRGLPREEREGRHGLRGARLAGWLRACSKPPCSPARPPHLVSVHVDASGRVHPEGGDVLQLGDLLQGQQQQRAGVVRTRERWHRAHVRQRRAGSDAHCGLPTRPAWSHACVHARASARRRRDQRSIPPPARPFPPNPPKACLQVRGVGGVEASHHQHDVHALGGALRPRQLVHSVLALLQGEQGERGRVGRTQGQRRRQR